MLMEYFALPNQLQLNINSLMLRSFESLKLIKGSAVALIYKLVLKAKWFIFCLIFKHSNLNAAYKGEKT